MEEVTLYFSIDGCNGGFKADTGLSPDDWESLNDDDKEEIASELYYENVQWSWSEGC